MADKPTSRISDVERPKVDRKARLKLPPVPIHKQDPSVRRCNWNEVVIPFTEEEAIDEATRCIQCPGAPCIPACPVQNDIPAAFWMLEQGDFVGAANKFRETSTMPEICGRICPQERLCEGSCVVGNPKLNMRPVAIGRLEAFLADYQRHTLGGFPRPTSAPPTGRSVAVVGGGPAGITVAELLAAKGHSVTIFDLWPRLGGILRYGIPNFKLEKELLEEKEALLEELGVKFCGGVIIGKDLTVDDLLAQGFDAVFLGHGSPIDASTQVPGEDLKGVWHATEFLVRANLPPEELPSHMREPLTAGHKVAVIGGGDTSMDCVRTAIRLGAEEVTCVYRRTDSEMPGRAEERIHAKEEGVKFHFLAAPVGFVGDKQGKIKGVECVKMELGEPDVSGRRSPIPVAGSEFFFEADMVVLAVGYWPDLLIPDTTPSLESRKGGTIVVNSETGQTSRPGVFAGGDVIRGADLVVTAVADGRRAADSMDSYLRSLGSKA